MESRHFTQKMLIFREFTSGWLDQQVRIILAVILQDMKSRFGASYWSYLIAIGWPLSHMLVLILGYMFINQYAPLGDEPLVFAATAAIPYLFCLYPARLIAMTMLINRPFLSYNIIYPMHLIIARVVLEFMNVTISGILVFLICAAFGANMTPISLSDAAGALGAAVMLGISLGLFFAVIAGMYGSFVIIFIVLVLICLYFSSFVFIPYYMLGSQTLERLSYNPIFCIIKWLRSAYYPVYQLSDVPVGYIFAFVFVFIFLGLLAERIFRGHIIH